MTDKPLSDRLESEILSASIEVRELEQRHKAEIAELQRRLDAAEKDAQRYRWLNQKRISGTGVPTLAVLTEDGKFIECPWATGEVSGRIDIAIIESQQRELNIFAIAAKESGHE